MTGRYKLPPAFIRDCLECDCDVGDYIAGHLIATPAQLAELRNRAEFYIDGTDASPPGLITAARAVLAALGRIDMTDIKALRAKLRAMTDAELADIRERMGLRPSREAADIHLAALDEEDKRQEARMITPISA